MPDVNRYRDERLRNISIVGVSSGNALAESLIAMESRHGAHTYAPMPVVLAKDKGVYLWDEQGRRYLDMMSAYSAVSLGHAHPRSLEVLARKVCDVRSTQLAEDGIDAGAGHQISLVLGDFARESRILSASGAMSKTITRWDGLNKRKTQELTGTVVNAGQGEVGDEIHALGQPDGHRRIRVRRICRARSACPQ